MKAYNHNTLALLVLPTAVILSGCAHGPEAGRGGIAELTHRPLYPIEIPSKMAPNQDAPISAEQGLRLDSDNTRQQLETLILRGAKVCFPAAVYQLNIRQARIERELTGGLAADAAVDVIKQRHSLSELRSQMRMVDPEVTCVASKPTAQELKDRQRDSVRDLLNADNQFAIDSSAINPKYAARLAKASEYLLAHPELKLSITGHTDHTGLEGHNQALAFERAQTVAGFLVALGIDMGRINVLALASSSPYSPVSGAEHRLVNRRVVIDLVQAQSSAISERS